ncbi:hypothetical protein [Pseudooceanicola nitratireducens]|uniref:hypothetical protein n=1 Tax=Pseudooceanicola nitratireducens TaxID=517719 RepID=UPI0023F3C2EF|nr:hypothetical protein [Pseudooceanicola nitratireducens]
MKRLILISALALAPLPALSQDGAPQDSTEDDSRSLMSRGIELFFRGLSDEMEPAMRDFGAFLDEAGPAMRSFLQEMGPALSELFADVKDFSVYHPPERLPNGDIIMRRKTPDELPDAPDDTPDGRETAPEGAIDL